jgi:glycosyltransferase involved in cell wall biosynthesis
VKVLVLNTGAAFQRGGAELLAEELARRLSALPGVEAEMLRLPFQWVPTERLIEEMLLHRQLRLVNVDRVIALKFPAYLVPHHHKTLWLLHQFRQAYDLADAGQGLSDDGREGQIKRAIRTADQACFAEVKQIFVNSPVTQARLQRYNGLASEVLYPPLNDAELFRPGPFGDYIFAGGRVAPGKRQHLLIEAFAQLPGDLRLVIAGPPETAAYAQELSELVAKHRLGQRVDLRLGFRPRTEIAELANGARACAYLPFDEDSLGYVTMEAFAAGKPVVTVNDAGGLLEIVSDETGAVAEPNAESLAAAIEALSPQPTARAKGEAAKALWEGRGLTWDTTLERLLA